jgi:ankyrin repeat protein
MNERADSVFSLLDSGQTDDLADLLQTDPSLAGTRRADGTSAVMWARYLGDESALTLLLAARPWLDGFEGAAVGDLDAVRTAIASDPTFPTAFATDGFTALGLAAFFGQDEVVRLLLTAGADPNSVSHNGMRVAPLHSSVAGRHAGISADLVAAGADVNAIQTDGYTPLHESAQNGDVATTELLLAAGADPASAKDDGQRPADSARTAGHLALADRLEQAASGK